MAPKVGDRVNVRVTGAVESVTAKTVRIVTDSGGAAQVAPEDTAVAWETVEVYLPGELYQDADGCVVERQQTRFPGDRWRVVARSTDHLIGSYVHEDIPKRPLRRLVPEPVASATPAVVPTVKP